MIILLDLNYTLVSNSVETASKPWPQRQKDERYRQWLVDLIQQMKPELTVLITARPEYHQEWSLQNIERLTGWRPEMACFNWANLPPPRFKELALKEKIFPAYGADPSRYLAIESNLDTHKMYAKYGIKGMKVFPVSEAANEPDEVDSRPALF